MTFKKAREKPGFSIITCTNKSNFMNKIFDNYSTQKWPKKELIIILNRDDLDVQMWRKKAKRYANISVYKLPESKPLGACLNYAVSQSQYDFIAKFDDDDYYAPNYLTGMYRSFVRSGAEVIGKRSFFTYIQHRKLLIERFPHHQNQMTRRVAGATLTFKKKVFQRVQFSHVSLGEDVRFLNACRKNGYKIYSTNRYNYLCIRRKNRKFHTWQPSDSYLLENSRMIARTTNYKAYVNK